MPINRIFFKDANDFSAKQPMRPFPLERVCFHSRELHKSGLRTSFMAVYKQLGKSNPPWKFPDRFIRFFANFSSSRRWGEKGRGRVVVKVGYSVSSFCPQFHLPRSRFPFVTVPRLPANWLTAKENAITRERFMKNEPRRLKRRFMELWRAATFFSNIQFNLKQRTATRYFSLMFRWDICWLCTKCDGWGKKFAYFETSFFFYVFWNKE